MKSTAEVVKIREVIAWLDGERDADSATVALSAVTREGKPVALNASETRRLAERLLKLADVLDSLVEQKQRDPADG